MKMRLLTLWILLVAVALVARADALGYSKGNPLVIGLDNDYAPLEYVDGDGLPQGLDVDFTQVLMSRMHIPYTYAPNAWAKISGDVLNGRVGLAMMVYSPYRKDIVNYSRAVFRLYYQIVYRKDDGDNKFDVRNLGGKNVAYMASRPVTDTLTRAGAIPTIVTDLPMAISDLSKGQYDAVICFSYQANYHIRSLGIGNLQTEDLTLTPREYCYVSLNKELIDEINVQLKKLEDEGVINRIYGSDITSQLSRIVVPRWIWYALAAMLVAFLLYVIVVQKRHQKRLQQEMEHAQRSERLKTVFLGNVSHALRTPLNAIIGFSDVLNAADEGTLSREEHQQLCGLINQNGQQLLYFINELLQLSNIESSQMTFHRVGTNVDEVLQSYRQELLPQLEAGVELRVTGDKAVSVDIDPELMRIVTMHLLHNAVRHTRKGEIEVSYAYERNGLRLVVRDTGDGLPEKLKDNIFALLGDEHTFVQSENPGLGLSICKAIVDKCGGDMGVASTPGEGSTFWYWVPVRKVDNVKD